MGDVAETTSKTTVLDEAAGIKDPARVAEAEKPPPDPEVTERARRPTFTARNRLELLVAYEAAADDENGALPRREDLYPSHNTQWRHAGDTGAMAGLAAVRGHKRRDRQAERIDRLQAEHHQLEQGTGQRRCVVNAPATTLWFAKSHLTASHETHARHRVEDVPGLVEVEVAVPRSTPASR